MLFNSIALHLIILSSLSTTSSDYWIKQGDRAYNQQNIEESIIHYSRAIEERPKHALGYIKRAKAHRAAGQFVRYADDMRKALELDPHFTRSYLKISNEETKKFN